MFVLRSTLLFIISVCCAGALSAQFTYPIKADSTRLFGCDGNELIIENHTQNVQGFLYNTGNGRTIFKKGLVKLSDSIYIIGGDSLKIRPNAWVQGGNRYGTTGVLGTLDSNHLDFYTNNGRRGRWTAKGNLIIGATADNGEKFQVTGNGTWLGQVVTGGFIRMGDPLFNNVLGLRIYGDTLSGSANSNHYAVIGQNVLEPLSIYNVNKQGGAVFFDDRNGIVPLRFMVKPAGTTITTYGGGFSPAGNFLLGGTSDSGSFKMQVRGTSFFSDNVVMANYKQLSVGGTYIVDNPNGRYITTLAPQPFSVTSGAGGTAQFNGYVKLSSATNVIITPGNSTNSAVIFSAIPSGPSSTTMTFGNLRNDAFKKAVINTADFNAGGIGSTAIDLYLYPGKEIVTGNQGNLVLSYDGTNARGNVGIGTGSPGAQLHTTGSVRFAGLTNDDTQARVLVSDANGNLYYRNASSLAMGDIPRTSLAVNGPVKAKSLVLSQTGWPDYVFDSAYQLSSLKEVEDYIRRNNRLPGIPSAAEIESNGLSIGDNQAALLKKIEELTLYNIEQEKKIDRQNGLLEAQSKALELLRQQLNELQDQVNTKLKTSKIKL